MLKGHALLYLGYIVLYNSVVILKSLLCATLHGGSSARLLRSKQYQQSVLKPALWLTCTDIQCSYNDYISHDRILPIDRALHDQEEIFIGLCLLHWRGDPFIYSLHVYLRLIGHGRINIVYCMCMWCIVHVVYSTL